MAINFQASQNVGISWPATWYLPS